MVDPGFHGRLSLPLHNLTSNSYRLVGGEGFIWVEATKTKPVNALNEDAIPRQGRVFDLPDNKKDLTLREYLRKADPKVASQDCCKSGDVSPRGRSILGGHLDG